MLTALTSSTNDEQSKQVDKPEPVDAEIIPEMPEVPALLTEVIDEDESGIVATAELTSRIGWDPKSLGEALRRPDIPAPRPPRQRVGGGKHPVSVQEIDPIITAILSYSDTE